MLVLIACAMAIGLSACAQSPLKVLSATRYKGHPLGPSDGFPEKPGYVFLKLSYLDLSEDDRKKDLYITDGKTRYPVQFVGFSIDGAKRHSFVVATVPASQLEFQAVLGDYPPTSFKVDSVILDQP
ncbi:MAG TPA: hypothetical protein VGQ94_08160 [Terriglobales bacterium]|nr:hypothetical protein [Terriglobales bacterium]